MIIIYLDDRGEVYVNNQKTEFYSFAGAEEFIIDMARLFHWEGTIRFIHTENGHHARYHDSVVTKEENHECPYCSR